MGLQFLQDKPLQRIHGLNCKFTFLQTACKNTTFEYGPETVKSTLQWCHRHCRINDRRHLRHLDQESDLVQRRAPLREHSNVEVSAYPAGRTGFSASRTSMMQNRVF